MRFTTHQRLLIPATVLLLGAVPCSVSAQDPFDPAVAADEFIVRERTRAAVAQALELGLTSSEDPAESHHNSETAIDALVAIGPEAVPYLINEVDQELPGTFFFAAQALSRFDTPASAAALRKSIERSNRSPEGQFALERKGWASFCLGLMGKADAVELVDKEAPLAGRAGLTATVTYLEGTAFASAPASIPFLLDQLDRYRDDPQRMHQRRYVIRSLRRIGDASAIPKLVEVLDEPLAIVRREATYALGAIGTAETIPVLIGRLDDPEESVRFAAATSLEKLRPPGIAKVVSEKLDVEYTPFMRGVYYRIIAAEGGLGELETLVGRKTTNSKERRALVVALGSLRSPKAIPALSSALSDPDTGVAAHAVAMLADIGTPAAFEAIVPMLAAREFALVKTAVGQLGRVGATETAPMIVDRLLRAELSREVTDGRIRDRVPILGEAIVTLRSTARLDDLRTAAAMQKDAKLVAYLDSLLPRLTALDERRDDLEGWIEATSSPDPRMRKLAYEELVRLAAPAGFDAMAEQFGGAAPEDRVAMLHALVDVDAPQVRTMLRETLLGNAYDVPAWRSTREMAAWAARRLGDDAMVALLREAVERRRGRDARVMIYLGLAGGRDALPTFEAYRIERWHFLHAYTGEEQKTLDRLARDLRAGRATDWTDVRPDQILFR